MQGWWRRDPFFARYMLREATALAAAAYAIVLMVGVLRLAQGEAAWNGWLAALRTPGSMLLHAVLRVAMGVHAKSWFETMPQTLPMMVVGGRPVTDATITRIGWAAALLASLGLLALVFITGLAVPLGWPLSADLLSYPRMLAFAQHWLGKAFLLAVIALFAWHAAHRLLCSLHDLGIHKVLVAKLVGYGAAFCISLIAAISLVSLGG